MLCGLNRQHYQTLEEEVGRTTKTLKDYLKSFWQECKQFFTMEYEWYGVIASVQPIQDPEQPTDGSCYHILTLKDGQSFDLVFPHVQFATLAPRLQTGYALKITYQCQPNHDNPRVINIYPRPYYKITPYECFMDEDSNSLTDETLVKVHYLENQVTRLDFLQNPEDKPKSD